MITFTTNQHGGNDIVRMIYQDGICLDTLLYLCPPFEDEDQKTYRGRLSVLVAPNIIATVINNRVDYMLNSFTFKREDGSVVSSKYIAGIVKEIMISGSVYLVGNDVVSSDIFLMDVNPKNRQQIINLWERDYLRFIAYEGESFLTPTRSVFSKYLATIASYYTIASTHNLSLTISSFPMFTRKGLSTEDFTLSPTTVFEFRGEGEVSWVTHDGNLLMVTETIIKNHKDSIFEELGLLLPGGLESNQGAITTLVSHNSQQSRIFRLATDIANVLRCELIENEYDKVEKVMSLVKEI